MWKNPYNHLRQDGKKADCALKFPDYIRGTNIG